MEVTWNRLHAWFAVNATAVLESLNPPASQAAIDELERQLAIQLPDDVKRAYLRHDGQRQCGPSLYGVWRWLPLSEVASEWAQLREIQGDDVWPEPDDDEYEVQCAWHDAGWIPLMESGTGDCLCIDINPGPRGNAGQVLDLKHDDGDREVVAASFHQWLESVAMQLESGSFRYSNKYKMIVPMEEL